MLENFCLISLYGCRLSEIHVGQISRLQLGFELSLLRKWRNACDAKVTLFEVDVSSLVVSFQVFVRSKSGSLAMKSVLYSGT